MICAATTGIALCIPSVPLWGRAEDPALVRLREWRTCPIPRATGTRVAAAVEHAAATTAMARGARGAARPSPAHSAMKLERSSGRVMPAGVDTPFLVDPVAELTSWFSTFSEAEREWFRDPRVSAAFAADARESVRQGVRGWLRESLVRILPWSFDLGSIHTPVRAFHGELDTYEPIANAQRVIDRLPDAQLWVCPGVSHLGPLMHPEDLLGACADPLEL